MNEDLDKVAPEAKTLARAQSHEQPSALKREPAIHASVIDVHARADTRRRAQRRPNIRPGRFTHAHLQRRRGRLGAKAGQMQQAAIALGDNEPNVVKAAAATPPPGLDEGIIKPVMKMTREPQQRTVEDPRSRPCTRPWPAPQKGG